MKKFTLKKALLSSLLLVTISAFKLSAQSITISPANANIGANQSQSFTITCTGFGADDNDRTFAYTITGPGATIPATPTSFNCTSGCDVESHLFTFPTAGTYTINVTVTQTEGGGAVASNSTSLIVWTPNLYASFGAGPIRNFNSDQTSGVLNHGGDLYTAAVTVDAIAKNAITGTDVDGNIYYLDNVAANDGVVTLYSSPPNTNGETLVATADLNGASTSDLNFARLGFDPTGVGWILAGDGTDLYIASFTGNGVNPTTINVLGTVTITAPGTIADFENGDLAISGTGVMYAVASVTAGDTYVYSINSLAGPTYTAARKWRLTQGGGANFTTPVNGIAFTSTGSVHLSTSDDLFFIDQASATIVSGTIDCAQVFNLAGFTDIGSDNFPVITILPVKLIGFSGSINNGLVTLSWETENEQNFSHFEIERKGASGGNFQKVGTKTALNGSGRNNYSFADNISNLSENVVYYRLKMLDLDGKFNYSQTILVRKDGKALSGIKVSPNPVINGTDATLRFNSSVNATINIRVVDMTGRTMLEQQNRISQGVNSVTINNIRTLQSGMYIVQMKNGDQVESATFTITR